MCFLESPNNTVHVHLALNFREYRISITFQESLEAARDFIVTAFQQFASDLVQTQLYNVLGNLVFLVYLLAVSNTQVVNKACLMYCIYCT